MSVQPDIETLLAGIDRRKMAVALIATLAGAGLALKTTDAKADIDQLDVEQAVTGALESVFGDLVGLIFEVLTVVQFPTPGRIRRLIDEIIGLLEGSDSTYIGADPEGPLERSYPTLPVVTPVERLAATMQRALDTRSRVAQSERINGQVAQVQGELALEEEAIVLLAQAAEFSATRTNQGILLMQQNTNIRLGQVSSQLAALTQLVGDLVMLPVADREQAAMNSELFRDGQGNVISPPVERSAGG